MKDNWNEKEWNYDHVLVLYPSPYLVYQLSLQSNVMLSSLISIELQLA